MQTAQQRNEARWFHAADARVLNEELWFRPSAEEGLKRGEITATLRLGDRLIETPACREKCYAAGQAVRLRIFDKEHGFGPWEAAARVRSLRVLRLGEVRRKDLESTEFRGWDLEHVRLTLKEYYGRDVSWDDTITIVGLTLNRRDTS